MLTYRETWGMILSLERSIKAVNEKSSGEQIEYVKHLKRLLKHYVVEHRKAAKRENEHAMR